MGEKISRKNFTRYEKREATCHTGVHMVFTWCLHGVTMVLHCCLRGKGEKIRQRDARSERLTTGGKEGDHGGLIIMVIWAIVFKWCKNGVEMVLQIVL